MNNEIERLKAENEKLKAENEMLRSVSECFYRIVKGYFVELSNLDGNAGPLKTMLRLFDNFYRKTEEPTVPEAGKAEKEGTEE